jgi:Tfp pilus assembly protein FimT
MPRVVRTGYTVLELLAVLAVLVILGAVVIPSIAGFYGNSKQRGAADLVRTRLNEARAKAMERGVPFRVAINSDKTRLRVAPDDENFASVTADDPPAFDSTATEDKFEEITVELTLEEGDERIPDSGGWLTIVTMRPDGSAKEARSATISVKQGNIPPLRIQVRGVTGRIQTVSGTQNGGAK